MFTNTIKTFKGIIDDISRLLLVITVGSQLCAVGYFTYASIVGNGYLTVNIILIAVSLVYLVVYLLARLKKKDKRLKKAQKITRKVTTAVKLTLKAVTLSVTVYGIYLSNDADGISIILATLSIILWIIQTLFEVIRYYGELKYEELKVSIAKDVEFIRKPAEAVKDAVHNFKESVPEALRRAENIVDAVKSGARGFGKIKSFFRKRRALKNGAIYLEAEDEMREGTVASEVAEEDRFAASSASHKKQ